MLSSLHAGAAGVIEPATWRSRREPKPDPVGPSQSEAEVIALKRRIEEINASIEQRVRQAHESGRQEGEAAVRSQAESSVRDVVERLVRAIEDAASARSEAIHQAEGGIVRLAIEIARRILHRELSLDPRALEDLITAALRKVQTHELCRIRVHPDLEQLIRDCLAQLGRNSEVEIIGDASQPRGATIFEMSRGSLDASIETQLCEIERSLAKLGEPE